MINDPHLRPTIDQVAAHPFVSTQPAEYAKYIAADKKLQKELKKVNRDVSGKTMNFNEKKADRESYE